MSFFSQWWNSRSRDNLYGFDVGNFGVVSPRGVYRSACPNDVVLDSMIAKLKLTDVLDLRKEAVRPTNVGPNDQRLVPGTYCHYRHAALDDKAKEIDVRLVEACALLVAEAVQSGKPILVHCAGGRHRTGAVIATYRVRFEQMDPAQAIAEAYDYGLYGRFGHQAYVDYIEGLKR